MPGYSHKAYPYLNAIAQGVFTSVQVRDWMIARTAVEASFTGSNVLIEEQREKRWVRKPTKQPFWANYYCGRNNRCTCRIEGSRALESDAVFFFRNNSGRVLAVHVELKRPNEAFELGQPEGYPLRADCFVITNKARKTHNEHQDWTTVLFCDEETARDQSLYKFFKRIITHRDAAEMLSDYPSLD